MRKPLETAAGSVAALVAVTNSPAVAGVAVKGKPGPVPAAPREARIAEGATEPSSSHPPPSQGGG